MALELELPPLLDDAVDLERLLQVDLHHLGRLQHAVRDAVPTGDCGVPQIDAGVQIVELRIPPGIHLEANTPVSINNQKENCHDQLCTWFGVEAR